jgi:hypothetical protein
MVAVQREPLQRLPRTAWHPGSWRGGVPDNPALLPCGFRAGKASFDAWVSLIIFLSLPQVGAVFG